MAPTVDHLFRRAPADPELKPTLCDQVCSAGILRHIERILVAHVDHAGTDLNMLGLRADRRQ
jgi:hypothetical protein